MKFNHISMHILPCMERIGEDEGNLETEEIAFHQGINLLIL
jgi:hypothetical protein